MYFNRKLWLLTANVRKRIVGSVMLGLVESLLGIVRLLLLGWLISLAVHSADAAKIWPVALSLGLAIGLYAVCGYWRKIAAHHTAAQVQREIRLQLYDRFIELGPAFLASQRSGELATTSVEGVEQLEIYFGRYLPQLFVALLTPFVIFAVASQINIAVALVLLSAALFTLLAPSLFQRWDSRFSLLRSQAYRAFAAEFLDALQGIVTLKAFGQSKAREGKLAEKAEALFQSTMWVMATNSLTRAITDIGITLGAAIALAVAAHQFNEGTMSYQSLLLVLLLGVEVFKPLRELRGLLHDGMLANAAAQQLFNVLDAPTTVGEVAHSGSVFEPSICFKQVAFSYPCADKDVVTDSLRGSVHRDLSFSVAAGQRIGVVGSSGGGKSTIINLLLRHYQPQGGSIALGGVNIQDMDLQSLRAQFSVVSQDTYLFHASVLENLKLANPEASIEQIERAAQTANAHSFISQLEHGYHTVIGERGARLSGGQRQRLAIARALLRDAPILILDEALSAVDVQNEQVIQSALNRLMRGRTCLVLAHRLSSVIDCDEIILLDKGRVAERGSHQALMAQEGQYAGLMASQIQATASHITSIPTQPAQLTEHIARQPVASNSNEQEQEQQVLQGDKHSWAQVLRMLFSLAAPWKGQLTLTFLLATGRVSAFIGVSLCAAMVSVTLKSAQDYQGWLTGLMISAVVAALLHWLESWVAHDMAFRMLSQMRIALFKQLERLAPAFMVRRRSGDMINLATHDIEMVEYFFAHTIAPVLVAILVPGAVLMLLASFSPVLSFALLPFLATVALMPVLFRQRLDTQASKARTFLALIAAHSVDTLQGLNEVLNYQASEPRRKDLSELINQHKQQRLGFFKVMTLQSTLTEIITISAALALTLLAIPLVNSGQLDALYLPLIALAAIAAFLPVIEVSDVARQLADTLAATSRLMQVEQASPTVQDNGTETFSANLHADEQGYRVEFRDLSFNYAEKESSEKVLKHVNITLAPGSKVALVGSSGAGKSTLAHLLMRFWDPQQGQILIQGQDIRQIPLAQLQNQVAIVAQDTYLFNESIESNLRMAKPQASQAELDSAIASAQLQDFIANLPLGLATRVGERGHALSGGQRQRLSIARAFLRDAPILILDEATSYLDTLSERAVQQALAKLMKGRTSLVIAHRLSSVEDADEIILLNAGEVVEQGKHKEMMHRGGAYAQLIGYQQRMIA